MIRNILLLAVSVLCFSCLQKERDSEPGLTPGEPGYKSDNVTEQDSLAGDAYGNTETETATGQGVNNATEASQKNPVTDPAARKKDSAGGATPQSKSGQPVNSGNGAPGAS